MQWIYLVLCVLGAALPLSRFLPWLARHGVDVPLLVAQAVATPIAAFAWADVLVSGVVVIVLIVAEGRRLRMRGLWLPLGCLAVGPSLALPAFLLMRERHLAACGRTR
ncbi:DUF2834 domain-containing protein [Luteimonas sp. TWI662]